MASRITIQVQKCNLHDYGLPIQRAAEISGWEGGAFTTLLFQGAFGPPPTEPVSNASLLYVAAATALKLAENAGIQREQISPILMKVADAVYVRLAMLELTEFRWHPVTCGTMLLQKFRSDDCQSELEDMLAVRTGNTKRYAAFPPCGPVVTNSPPQVHENSSTVPVLDAWYIAELIRIRVTGLLFY